MNEFVSVRSPDEVLNSLRARGKQWRESSMPAALRAAGFYGVKITVIENEFWIQLEGGNRRNGYHPRFVGTVLSDPRGSRIVGDFGATLSTWIGNGIWVVWSTLIAYWAESLFFWLFLMAGGAFIFASGVKNAEPWRAGILQIVESTVTITEGLEPHAV